MSYSGAESSMEDAIAATNRRHQSQTPARRRCNGSGDGGGDGGDPEAWNAFAESFSKVQNVLDRNRELIQQANENHQSRIADNMVKNVAIINELNGNISKVASIYSDLSSNFTGMVRERSGKGGSSGGSGGSSSNGRNIRRGNGE